MTPSETKSPSQKQDSKQADGLLELTASHKRMRYLTAANKRKKEKPCEHAADVSTDEDESDLALLHFIEVAPRPGKPVSQRMSVREDGDAVTTTGRDKRAFKAVCSHLREGFDGDDRDAPGP